jgi:glc operon protein GlcG
MTTDQLATLFDRILEGVARRVPAYAAKPEDAKSGGHAAVFLLGPDGLVRGRMFGTDKAKMRNFSMIAWRKAIQTWVTGHDTGTFEALVYSKQLDEGRFGIMKPDFIGWEGGQVVRLADGTTFAAGFSGFTGASDLAIVREAVAEATTA